MEIQLKLKKFGGSKMLIIPSEICKKLDLREDDMIEIDIKTKNGAELITEFECVKCKHRFVKSNNEDNYCPACDCENIRPIKIEWKYSNGTTK